MLEDYAVIPPSDYEKGIVWRCYAIENSPTDVSNVVGKNDSDRARIFDSLTKLNFNKAESRKRMKWKRRSSPSRFSDGDVPVVYTAEEFETSVFESFHWAYERMEKKDLLGKYCLQFQVVSLSFNGRVKDLVPYCPPYLDLVHPDKYACCNKLGQMAFEDSTIDALRVPSARRHFGVNIPIFREENVGKVVNSTGISVFGGEDGAVARSGQGEFDIGSQPVYEKLIST